MINLRKLLPVIATILFTSAANAQQGNHSTSAPQFNRDFVSNKPLKSHPPAILVQPASAITNYNAEKYRKFKKMRTAGIVLTGVGAGLMTTGIVLIANSNHHNSYYDDYDSYYYSDFDDNTIGGVLCIVFGVSSIGGGIPLWIIGDKKMKKYGGGTLSLSSSKSGMGVAYHF